MRLSSFFDDLVPGQVSCFLMDTLPDIIMFVKNRSGVYQHVNRAFTETLQRDYVDIVGKTDRDIYTPEYASVYISDDKSVCDFNKPIMEKAELVTYRPGVVRWYITNKIPLYNVTGKVVGIAGVSRLSTTHTHLTNSSMGSVSMVVQHIYDHTDQLLSVEQLSSLCGISVSSLQRHSRKFFQCSIGALITQIKISTACKLLADYTLSVANVGEKIGYPDPVVFSRFFKRNMRMSPFIYRKSLKNIPRLK